jgi:hypothetical protein
LIRKQNWRRIEVENLAEFSVLLSQEIDFAGLVAVSLCAAVIDRVDKTAGE